jgi:hypothetical protein
VTIAEEGGLANVSVSEIARRAACWSLRSIVVRTRRPPRRTSATP